MTSGRDDDGIVPAPEPEIDHSAFYDIFEGTRGSDGQTIRLAEPETKSDE